MKVSPGIRTDFRKRQREYSLSERSPGWTILIDDEDLAPLTEFFNERHAKLEKLQQDSWDATRAWEVAVEKKKLATVDESNAWAVMNTAHYALQTELDARATRQAAQVAA